MTRTGATFSPCRRYRYALWRQWDDSGPTIVFCGLNPSTADETVDDPTIRRELGYARAWGFGRLVKVNAYALRSTDPKGLLKVADPEGPDNLATILHWAAQAQMFVAAWGNNIAERHAFVLRTAFRECGILVHVLRLTQQGHPQHPLYLSKTLRPFPWLAPVMRRGLVAASNDDHPINGKAEAPGGAALVAEQPAGTVRAPAGGAARSQSDCPHHDAAHVCDECDEGFYTDGSGFVHASELHGRIPLRRCQRCRNFVPRERWDAEDWFCCLECSAQARPAQPEASAC